MKVLNGEIFAAQKPLETLSKERLPIRSSYKVAKLIKDFASHLEIIEKLRIELVQRYGTKDEKGNYSIKQDTDNWFKFIEEMNILFAQEVEIKLDEKIEIPFEVEGKSINVEPSLLISLDKFIDIK
jgi:hypothetical protein